MTSDFKRQQLKKEVIEKVERHVSTYRPFESIIDIYVDMRIEKEQIENELEENKENYVLKEILQNIKNKITLYEEQLLII